jgi:outer membrane receptor protein involved in Fe transport
MKLSSLPALIFLAAAVRAEDGVFLSLTRSAEPLDAMPTNVSVLTADDIRRSGALTLPDALRLLPSVQVQEPAVPGQYSSLRLRGVPASNQVQVVVDDQPLGGVFIQDLDIGQIPVDDIERIEILRGAAAALYGANTIGGVVHIITKRPRGKEILTSLGYETRSFKTHFQRAEFEFPGRSADARLNIFKYRTAGFQRNSDGDGLDVSGAAGLTFSKGQRLELEADRTDTQSGDPQGTPVPLAQWDGSRERQPVDPVSRVDQGNTRIRIRGFTPLGAGSLQTIFYGSIQDYVNDDPLYSLHTVLDKNTLGNDTRLLLPGRLTLGASYERDEYRSLGSPKLHGTDWGLYAQKAFTQGPIDILPGFRFDQHGTFGNTLNPRLTTVWRLTDRLKVSANAGRSFRSPTLVDLTQSFPAFPPYSGPFLANPQLRPEIAWSYDAGVQFSPSRDSTLSATGFSTLIRRRIAATTLPYPAANSLINAPRAETSGVETEWTGRLGSLIPRFSYTYQRAIGNSLASTRYVPLRRTPRHAAGARLTWEAPRRWALTGGARYLSKQFERDGEQGLHIPGRVLLDARIEKRILGAELFFSGENLTNRRTADAFGYGVLVPLTGRTFQGGITIRFKN